MLIGLSIRDVVLIDQLALDLAGGLTALTGETGAGKSILLDALGLALGGRSEARLVRKGAQRAIVTAAFELPEAHPANAMLAEHGLEADEHLTLRRVVQADGRSRAFVNDQPAGVALARALGEMLVEVHGQFDTQGLLNPSSHRDVLDAFAGNAAALAETQRGWRAWREAEAALAQARREAEAARAEESYLRHAVEELDELDPVAGEEARLAEERSVMQHAERVAEGINAALDALGGDGGPERGLAGALRELQRVADKAGGRLDAVIEALDRALVETEEAIASLQSVGSGLNHDAGALEKAEERLFALRAAARKHSVEVDALADLRQRLAARLALIEDQAGALDRLGRAVEVARKTYMEVATSLSGRRTEAAARLDKAVAAELPPLKLERARFLTVVERRADDDWGPDGLDRVAFTVATNPGADPGPLNKIASGGELARFMLALKVVLADADPVPTLVFDEVDSGISGAVAAAVGERLARLGETVQVLVVTHSPQVAARAGRHLHVAKSATGATTTTDVKTLGVEARREEIARMLSGASVTDEARAAAQRLIAGNE
ncbi:MAG: DNA repair protein RecN [Azospirillaceae bacterium]